jgi:hypothetical protein
MRRTIQKHRRRVFAVCVFTFICALGFSSARAFSWQDPQQPDSYNSNSGRACGEAGEVGANGSRSLHYTENPQVVSLQNMVRVSTA